MAEYKIVPVADVSDQAEEVGMDHTVQEEVYFLVSGRA